jgi:tRNA threonylcarbamoyladenosine biosynthesis protein TsaE
MDASSRSVQVVTRSAEETEAAGRRLGAGLRPGDVVALVGPLGAGKTVLARGIAEGAGARGHIASPSFVLIRDYDGPVQVHHADLYRIERPADVVDLGLDELADAGGILIVEWADRAGSLMPTPHISVDLAFGPTETVRFLEFFAPGDRADRLDGIEED